MRPMRPPWMRRSPRDLRAVDTCRACGGEAEPFRDGQIKICRECRLSFRVFAPIAHAAVYGDFTKLRALEGRIARFEAGDLSK